MIGTAAIPITVLSAKLINMNENSSATISQAPFGVRARSAVVVRPSLTAAS